MKAAGSEVTVKTVISLLDWRGVRVWSVGEELCKPRSKSRLLLRV